MRFISDLFLLIALYIVVRFFDAIFYHSHGWSIFSALGLWTHK